MATGIVSESRVPRPGALSTFICASSSSARRRMLARPWALPRRPRPGIAAGVEAGAVVADLQGEPALRARHVNAHRLRVRVAKDVAEGLGDEVVQLLRLLGTQARPIEPLARDVELHERVGLELVGDGEDDRLRVPRLELARTAGRRSCCGCRW